MKVHNDIVTALDAGLITALLLLDFIAAFDCVDPIFTTDHIHLQVLELKFGITASSLKSGLQQSDCFISDRQDALSSCKNNI